MDTDRAEALLGEIRDLQKQALDLQRRSTEIVERQYQRAAKLQDRAEAMQTRSEGIVRMGRRMMLLVIPVLVVLIGYVSWLLFGKLGM